MSRTRQQTAADRRRPGRPKLAEPSQAFIARQAAIVEVAAEVFRRKGYDAGSLDDVAAELHLRRASLYHYVNSKAELLNLIFDRAISSALERLEELIRIEDPEARLAALIRHQVRTVTDQPVMLAVFFDNRPRLDEAYEAGIRAKERRYVRIFAEAVSAAIEVGAIPRVNARYAANSLLGFASWTYKWFDPARDDAEDLARTLTELILHRDVGERPRT